MYRFTGFFARCEMDQPADLPAGGVWRTIESPFVGVGLSLDLPRMSPTLEEIEDYRKLLDLPAGTDWLFIAYDCWAGSIDFVFGLGVRGGQGFGPYEDSDKTVEQTYISLMGEFGVSAADAIRFAPFVRGFWGEN